MQPTPRWQITSGSVTLRLDHYAFLTNALIKAKGVPVFYLPAMYYPIQKDDRATGLLMPTYGTSTYKGFTFSDAFFWAISRSQDATFLYDYFKKRGQGMGGEYRYAAAPGSSGFFRFYSLNEHESTVTNADGSLTTLPAGKSYEVRSNVSQSFGRRWTARGRIDYFTDLATQQAYNTDIYDVSRSTRMFGGGISGSLSGLSINGTYDRTEYFAGAESSTVTGSSPRVAVSRNERPLFGNAPAYLSVNTEYVSLVRQTRSNGVVTDDRGLQRLDAMPTVRLPFTKLSFLTVNSSASWRGTYWTRSLSPEDGSVVDQGISRSYFDLQSRVTGPVVNRVWNTPDNGYASKWKHTVEPYYNIGYVTMVNNFDQIVQLDSTDYVLGGTTRMEYGVTNRLLAKRTAGGAAGSAREILAVVVNQTYYTDARASQYRLQLLHQFLGPAPEQFLPGPRGCPRHPGRSDQRHVPPGIRPQQRRRPEHGGRRQRGGRRLAPRERRLQPAAGVDVAGRADAVGQLRHRDDEHAEPVEPRRRHVHVQLRHRPGVAAEQPHRRLLQRPVLRVRRRVPDLQLPAAQPALPGAVRSSVQLLVHAGRTRDVLELLRGARRQRRGSVGARGREGRGR